MTQYRVLQITDCHLMKERHALYRDQPVFENLQAVIANAAQQHPDALLLTGDLAQQESIETYQQFTELLQAWPSAIYWLPGNHDDPELMAQAFTSNIFAAEKSFLLGKWQIILLSSKLPYDTGDGAVSEAQLEFLQQQLASATDKFVLIALHHHVLPVNGMMDNYPLKNSEQLLKIINNYSNVKVVLSGHVHQEFSEIKSGIQFLTTPSTSYQIKPSTEKLVIDNLQPGYRIIDLFDDGKAVTTVCRLV